MSILAGITMSIQGVFNTRSTSTASLWVVNSWAQLTGFFMCIIFWFYSGRQPFAKLLEIENKYYLFNGVLGAGIVFFVIKGMSKLGPSYAIMLILIAQLTIAYLIELLGMFGTEKIGFSWSKIIGVAIMLVGIVVFKWK